MPKKYNFHSTWQIDAPAEDVWAALNATPINWQQWWPGLVELSNVQHGSQSEATRFTCAWRSNSGYVLRFNCHVQTFVPNELLKLKADGQLEGTAVWKFRDRGAKTEISIHWDVITTIGWMNAFSWLLRPIFVHNHSLIMKHGEAGLNKWLRESTR